MAGPIHHKIKQSIQAAKGLYCLDALLVDKSASGKSDALLVVQKELA